MRNGLKKLGMDIRNAFGFMKVQRAPGDREAPDIGPGASVPVLDFARNPCGREQTGDRITPRAEDAPDAVAEAPAMPLVSPPVIDPPLTVPSSHDDQKSHAEIVESLAQANRTLEILNGSLAELKLEGEAVVASVVALRDTVTVLEGKVAEKAVNADTVAEQAKVIQDSALRLRELEANHTLEYVIKPMAHDLILIHDRVASLRKALAAAEMLGPARVTEGLDCISSELLETLSRLGVTPMADTVDPFDPRLQRVAKTVFEDVPKDNRVIEVSRPGYLIHGKVLRSQEIVLGKHKK